MDKYDARALRAEWFPVANDVIGGWCVLTADVAPSQVDFRAGDVLEVASFVTEAVARHVATLHNAWNGKAERAVS